LLKVDSGHHRDRRAFHIRFGSINFNITHALTTTNATCLEITKT
jgi:hypothetical protein